MITTKEVTVCNVCGKEFGIADDSFKSMGIHETIGYGSAYDGDIIDLDMCSDCFDDVIHDIASRCEIDPIIPSEF